MGTNSIISLLFCSFIIFSAAVVHLARGASPQFKSASAPTPTLKPNPEHASTPEASDRGCSMNLVKLAICSPLLSLPPISIGGPLSQPCCATLQSLLDVELSVCLCLAIKANVLGINVNVPIAVKLLLDTCKIQNPINFQCASP